jgi:hypothetical protein
MDNFVVVVLFDVALLAPPLAVVLGIFALALPSRLPEPSDAARVRNAA